MKLEEFLSQFENLVPISLQEDWDNSGIQCFGKNDISKVLVTLEVTNQVVNEAIEKKCDLIVSHHPLYFINEFGEKDIQPYANEILTKLNINNISLYSSHTCFDIFNGGNNDYFGNMIGIKEISSLPNDETNICRYGIIDSTTIVEFINNISQKLNIDTAYFSFTGNLHDTVHKVGWCTGSGSEFIRLMKEFDIDLFITGDLKYHKAIEAKEIGLNVLDVGHYASEYIFIENVVNMFKNNHDLTIIPTKIDVNPFVLIK